METGSQGEKIAEEPIEFRKFLEDLNYPIKKDDIIEQARKSSGMTEVLLQTFGLLPDKEYANADEVIKEIPGTTTV